MVLGAYLGYVKKCRKMNASMNLKSCYICAEPSEFNLKHARF